MKTELQKAALVLAELSDRPSCELSELNAAIADVRRLAAEKVIEKNNPPEGWILFGNGPVNNPDKYCSLDIARWRRDRQKWDLGGWTGSGSEELYAIREGSELAKINGLEPVDQKPTPQKTLDVTTLDFFAAAALQGLMVNYFYNDHDLNYCVNVAFTAAQLAIETKSKLNHELPPTPIA